jgi:hypothetical protein
LSATEAASAAPAPLDIRWHEANRRYLLAMLSAIRARLERSDHGPNGGEGGAIDSELGARHTAEEIGRAMSQPSALDLIVQRFGLSSFERDLLVLAAGIELDGGFASLVAQVQGNPANLFATFGLALAALEAPHWSALSPAGPLRRWRLLEVLPGGPLTGRPVQIDERVLHFLTGVGARDPRVFVAEEVGAPIATLPASQGLQVNQIVATWQHTARIGPSLPTIVLLGRDGTAKHSVARAACAELGLPLVSLSPHATSAGLDDAALVSVVARELQLTQAALFFDCEALDSNLSRLSDIAKMVERTVGAIFVACQEGQWVSTRPAVVLDVALPTTSEQRALWCEALYEQSSIAREEDVESLVSQFDMGASAIRAAASSSLARNHAGISRELRTALWETCRAQSRPRLDGLAQRIGGDATWDDLILPQPLVETLRQIGIHVLRRAKVHESWTFTRRGSRGLGVTALFSGQPGTGKTYAAEVIAGELGLDAYRVDLSQVLSKYIGETEKNLRRIFDAAEECAAVLIFDEADALFGKRGEVKDSVDRYGNCEVSYLLQRMETYRGLAVLTTNMKGALDQAFLRRLHFVVHFPFPNAEQRLDIWRRLLPPGPKTDGLDLRKLAQLNIAGGNIYSIARNAAFLAVHEGQPVRMEHVVRAAQSEFSKLERPLNAADLMS